jgi:adenylosuccinate lyase
MGDASVIDRYSRPRMAAIWSLEAQFRTWLDIEVLACEAWAKLGKIPAADLQAIQEKSDFDIESILKREEETKHDVAAFVSVVQERVGDAGRFIHLGLTSSDVVDTAFSYRMQKSAEMVLEELEKVLAVTKTRALSEKMVPMIGRTHGIHAEPTTMGTKWLLWHDALRRSRARITAAKDEMCVGKVSGAVGNYAHMPPEIEMHVCEKLGLRVDTVSTQVISRDRFAAYFNALALLGSTIEWICTEIRHLQRTEVGEAREGFSKGQKGSSAMPHKRNPISTENMCGLARLLRGMALPAMENVALWHERDISHSSVERVIGPDANILADYMLGRLGGVLQNLEIFPERMKENLEMLQGVIFSQRVLLGLIEKGMSRDDAYTIVQKHALAALDQRQPFIKFLKEDERVVRTLPPKALDAIFDARSYFQNIDYLYKKVFGE